MKAKTIIGAIILMIVSLSSFSLISCGDDDDEVIVNNNGGKNGGTEETDVPHELIGAWQMSDEQDYPFIFIYVFNNNGTGKKYLRVNYTENTAEKVVSFTYSYNRQNSTLTFYGTSYILAFQNNNTRMTLSINGNAVMTMYSWDGSLPTVDGNNTDGDDSGNGGGEGGGNSGQVPSIPTGVTAIVDGTSIAVSWQPVSGANSYKIYRSSNATEAYSLIGTTNSIIFRDGSPISGSNYYKVSAVNDKGESQQSNYVICNYSNSGGGSTNAPSAPTDVTATNVGSNSAPKISISWSSVSDATSYRVYRGSSTSGSYSEIGSSNSNTYIDYDPLSGSNYYRVKAVNSAGESPYSSYAYYDVVYPPATPNVSVSGTTSQTVTWSDPTGPRFGKPTSYKVHKRNPLTGEYELKTTTTSKSYSVPKADIHPGTNMYIVIAINSAGSSSTGIGYSEHVPMAPPSSFSVKKQGSNVVFTWSKVAWATDYQIFYSDSANGTYFILKQINDGEQTTCTEYNFGQSGKTYYFKIKANFNVTYGAGSDYSSYRSVTF